MAINSKLPTHDHIIPPVTLDIPMPEGGKANKRIYAKHSYIRGNVALWKGDASEKGAEFRQVVITSDEWVSTQGQFQVYALAGIGNGIVDGKLSVSEPKLLCDDEYQGLENAGNKFNQIIEEAKAQGFKNISFFEEMVFQAKLRPQS